MATPPMRLYSSCNVWPPACVASCSTAMPCSMISGPMPSPGVTRTFNFISYSPCSLIVEGCPFYLPIEPGCHNSIQLGDRLLALFTNLIGQNAHQIVVVDVFLAVGQCHKAIVGFLHLTARGGKAQLPQPIPQRRAA